MDLEVYNTRTNKIEKLVLQDEIIGIYTCGPTVYDKVHIGNIKTIFWSDFISSIIEYYYPDKVKSIINITDIDDKIINRLENKTIENLLKYTNKYTELFFKDLNNLSIIRYNNNHYKVTEHIEEIKKMINKLKEEDYAYELLDGSIYFDSSKVKEYPFPNHKKENIIEYENDRNIIRNENIKDNKDFILWKCKDEGDIYWHDENIKKGRPGWHIECSAISTKQLENVTIHIGGEDLKFPHHTCEILQSESYDPTKVFGKYWIHIGFLNFNGDKMSKSLGNIIRLEDIKINKFLLRYYLFQKYYRKNNDFDLSEIEQYKIQFLNLHKLYSRVNIILKDSIINNYVDINSELIIFDKMLKNINNDFDTKLALIELDKYVSKYLYKELTNIDAYVIRYEIDKMNKLFKILDKDIFTIPDFITELINKRKEAKDNKNYLLSDNIRKEIKEEGYILEDSKIGEIIIKNIN